MEQIHGLCTIIKKSRWWKTRENCQQPSRRLVTEGCAGASARCCRCPGPGRSGRPVHPAALVRSPGCRLRQAFPSKPNFISVFNSHVGRVVGKRTMSREESPLPWGLCTNKYPVLSPREVSLRCVVAPDGLCVGSCPGAHGPPGCGSPRKASPPSRQQARLRHRPQDTHPGAGAALSSR